MGTLPYDEVEQTEAEIAITSRFITFTSLTLSNRPDDLVQRRAHLVAAIEALIYLQEGIKPQQFETSDFATWESGQTSCSLSNS